MVFGISTTYVDRGDEYENDIPRRDQYRKLKQKLEKLQHDAVSDDESDNEANAAAKARKKQKSMGLLAE